MDNAKKHIKNVEFANLVQAKDIISANEIRYFIDMPIIIEVELGRAKMSFREILELEDGEIIELNRQAGDSVDVLANNKIIAKGEIVVLDNRMGIRIAEIISPTDIDKKKSLLQ